MSLKEFSVLLLVCTIWGLHFTVLRFAMGDMDVPPIFYAALRIVCLTIVLLPWLRWHKGQMKFVLLGGLCYGALNYAFMFPALELTTASAVSIAIELYMPFSILLSVIFLKERLGLWRSIGAGLAFIGVIIIGLGAPPETAGKGFTLGIILMACAAMSEAVGAISVKSVKAVKPVELLAWFGLVGACVLSPLTLILETDQLRVFEPERLLQFGLCLAYSVILVSLIAHGSYYWLLQRLPLSLVAPSGLLTTLIGVLGGAFILGEKLTLTLVAGGLVTLCGIALILWRNRKKNRAVHFEIS